MTTQTAKVKNGTIVLPREFRKSWKGAEVFVFPAEDTLIIKKIQKPLKSDWDEYERKLVKGRKKLSSKLIDEAIRWAKKR